jgi:hypothetical protein
MEHEAREEKHKGSGSVEKNHSVKIFSTGLRESQLASSKQIWKGIWVVTVTYGSFHHLVLYRSDPAKNHFACPRICSTHQYR